MPAKANSNVDNNSSVPATHFYDSITTQLKSGGKKKQHKHPRAVQATKLSSILSPENKAQPKSGKVDSRF